MSNSYYLQKIKHELCFVNNINHLGHQVFSIDMPVIVPINKLNATDGRNLLQRIIFQHFSSNASKQIGFMRGLITLSSEPDHFQTHLMLNCTTDQIAEPSETEWISAVENGLDTGFDSLPIATMSSDVKINAWGIDKYIYDVKIEFWPDPDFNNSFICESLIKYIIPENDTQINNLDFELGFNFVIYSKKANAFIPLLIKREDKPYFFMNDCEILEHEISVYDDNIGRELFVKCRIKK